MCNKHVVKRLKCQFQCTVCLDIKLTITHDFSKYYQCSVKSSLNCSICIDFHMIASNINTKIPNNNNTNPNLWINDFIYDFELSFAWIFLIVKIQLYCLHKRPTFKFINIYWVCWKSNALHLSVFSIFFFFFFFFFFSTTFRKIRSKTIFFRPSDS